jgi:hypothetical protein
VLIKITFIIATHMPMASKGKALTPRHFGNEFFSDCFLTGRKVVSAGLTYSHTDVNFGRSIAMSYEGILLKTHYSNLTTIRNSFSSTLWRRGRSSPATARN